MPVGDRTRMSLHRKLEAALGREEADTLMAHLPPVTWNEVATTPDLDTLGINLRGEMQTLRADLRTDFTEGMNRQIKWLVTFAAAWTSPCASLTKPRPTS